MPATSVACSHGGPIVFCHTFRLENMREVQQKAFFSFVCYKITDSVDPDTVPRLRAILDSRGGKESGLEHRDPVTHIISCNHDFSFAVIPTISDDSKPFVVTPFWVERCYYLRRLQREHFFSAHPNNIFSGITVVLAIAKILDPNPVEAKTMVSTIEAHGGHCYSKFEGVRWTHIITTSRIFLKKQALFESMKNAGCKIVALEWYNDCVNFHKRLDEAPYELPLANPLASSSNHSEMPETRSADLGSE